MKFKNLMKQLTFWLIILIILVLAAYGYRSEDKSVELNYGQFYTELNKGRIQEVTIQDSKIDGKFIDGKQFTTPILDGMSSDVAKSMLEYNTKNPDKPVKIVTHRPTLLVWNLLQLLFPVLLFVAFWIFIMRKNSWIRIILTPHH